MLKWIQSLLNSQKRTPHIRTYTSGLPMRRRDVFAIFALPIAAPVFKQLGTSSSVSADFATAPDRTVAALHFIGKVSGASLNKDGSVSLQITVCAFRPTPPVTPEPITLQLDLPETGHTAPPDFTPSIPLPYPKRRVLGAPKPAIARDIQLIGSISPPGAPYFADIANEILDSSAISACLPKNKLGLGELSFTCNYSPEDGEKLLSLIRGKGGIESSYSIDYEVIDDGKQKT
jgi:hypothetical protein